MAAQVNIAGTTSGNYIKLDNQLLAAYGQEVLLAAEPVLMYERIVQVRTELQTTPGSTINFLKYAALTGKSDIAETATIETDAMSASLVQISVQEHAKAVAASELLIRQSIDDVMGTAAVQLGRHYGRDMNRLIRDVLLAGLTSTLYANNRANRAAIIDTDYLDLETIQDASETLATSKVPKFFGQYYVAYASPHCIRRLKVNAGSEWIPVKDYADNNIDGMGVMPGEVGRIDDIRFIQTTLNTYIPSGGQDIYADGADTGDNTAVAQNDAATVHQTMIVGDWAIGLAVGLPVELRDDGVHDFGRTRKIAYYGIWGAGMLEAAHGLIIESA